MPGARFRLGALAAAIVGIALSIVAALLDPAAFFPGWLAGFLFWIGLSLGALVLLRSAGTSLGSLGTLLFAGLALWGYLAFMQFLTIWESNLTDEIPWYLDRIANGWLALTCLVAVFTVALPFLILVWWPLKRRPASLAAAAASLLLGYLFIDFWLIFPGLHIPLVWPTGPAFCRHRRVVAGAGAVAARTRASPAPALRAARRRHPCLKPRGRPIPRPPMSRRTLLRP
ncbi:MAG: hypothetical protein ACREE4_06950 [Stellaceae bacterium]